MKYTTFAIAGIVSMLVTNAMAAAGDQHIVTSKSYVDTEVGTRQAKIPAAGTNAGTAGTAVVTYTSTGNGTIGERGIYDGSQNYTSNDANKLATAAALNGAVTGLPIIETSKLTCANPNANPACTLWTVGNQNVYGSNSNSNN